MSNSGQKSGKVPERANFVNILSQYLKEKRNLGDISVGMGSKPESKGVETSKQQAMMKNSFLPNVDNLCENSKPNLVKSSDFFAQISGFGASSSMEDTSDKRDFRKPATAEPKNGQLTIFFDGQVLVYNDFPADKLKEIMALAKGCSSSCNGVVSDSSMENTNSNIDKTNSDIPDLNLNVASAATNSPTQDPPVERRQNGSGSDLRIARRNSLHKFFEKRKDRVAARAPYQVNNQLRGAPPPPKSDETKSSNEEGQSYLDLKL